MGAQIRAKLPNRWRWTDIPNEDVVCLVDLHLTVKLQSLTPTGEREKAERLKSVL